MAVSTDSAKESIFTTEAQRHREFPGTINRGEPKHRLKIFFDQFDFRKTLTLLSFNTLRFQHENRAGASPQTPRNFVFSVPLYLCTSAPLYLCTSTPLHLCTSVPLHLCTSVPLYLCTSAPLHLYTSVVNPLFSVFQQDELESCARMKLLVN